MVNDSLWLCGGALGALVGAAAGLPDVRLLAATTAAGGLLAAAMCAAARRYAYVSRSDARAAGSARRAARLLGGWNGMGPWLPRFGAGLRPPLL